jgi:integrase
MTASSQREKVKVVANKRAKTASKVSKKAIRISDAFDLMDGEIRIYRTTHSGDVWQMRMYVADEKRYVRKSLKTRDKTLAIERAKKDFIFYQAKMQNGEKLFSITTQELINRYRLFEQERLDGQQISEGRFSNIKTHTNRYLEFVGKSEKIQNISNKKFREYRTFRQSAKRDITMNAVINELTTIKKMYDFARTEGLINANYKIDVGFIRVADDDAKREAFTIDEYSQLINVSKISYRKSKDSEDKYYRELLNDFILAMANFGFRTGELLSLQWRDVYFKNDGSVEITIRAENTKVRKKREVIGNKGWIFKRVKERSKYTSDNCFVWSKFRKDEQITKTLLYDYWADLVQQVKTKHLDFDDTKSLYSLRHFYITIHLLAGKVDVYSIAKYTGTSLRQIEKTYDNVKDAQVSKKMMGTKFKFIKGELVLDDEQLTQDKKGESL